MRENYDQQILRSTQHLAVYVAVLLCRRGKGEKVIGWGLPHRVRQGADERLSISTLRSRGKVRGEGGSSNQLHRRSPSTRLSFTFFVSISFFVGYL